MRMKTGLGLLGAIALTGGCQASEEAVRNEVRAQMMTRCLADIAPRTAAVPGFDGPRFCTCVTDRAVGNRSVAELKAMFENKEGTQQEGRRAGTECLGQQLPGGVPPSAAAKG